ncbi:hypothetical protein GF386_06255 [Candidatus Pacearchaeota archaeon]|nr:hypothetical protein [Candidatus Pacearchaeota archaeon]MBD3283691.1 hypothetical protein [Candidatus Pacearchaeota archaeon]
MELEIIAWTLLTNGVRKITLGGGEPMLEENLDDILRILKS